MKNKTNEKSEALESLPGGAKAPITTSADGPERAADAGEPAAGESHPLTSEQVGELKIKADKADEYWDRLLRMTAEMENFKKRSARERQEAIKFANVSLLERLIPALDNFDMALAAARTAEGGSLDSLKTGISMVHNQLKGALAEAGLEEIDASNQPFDPNLHDAVSQQESEEVPEGHVLVQLRKGYKLRDRLIRPAGVVVARKPAV